MEPLYARVDKTPIVPGDTNGSEDPFYKNFHGTRDLVLTTIATIAIVAGQVYCCRWAGLLPHFTSPSKSHTKKIVAPFCYVKKNWARDANSSN